MAGKMKRGWPVGLVGLPMRIPSMIVVLLLSLLVCLVDARTPAAQTSPRADSYHFVAKHHASGCLAQPANSSDHADRRALDDDAERNAARSSGSACRRMVVRARIPDRRRGVGIE
jgi:hypothetical protein